MRVYHFHTLQWKTLFCMLFRQIIPYISTPGTAKVKIKRVQNIVLKSAEESADGTSAMSAMGKIGRLGIHPWHLRVNSLIREGRSCSWISGKFLYLLPDGRGKTREWAGSDWSLIMLTVFSRQCEVYVELLGWEAGLCDTELHSQLSAKLRFWKEKIFENMSICMG